MAGVEDQIADLGRQMTLLLINKYGRRGSYRMDLGDGIVVEVMLDEEAF